MKTFLCELILSCLMAVPGARPVDDLTYGTALYAYYQQDFSQALLEVMVAGERQRLGDDPVRFQLARGSFAFKERLYRMAAESFAAVDASELDALDRKRLAFHLAREHYRRRDWNALDAELAVLDPASGAGRHPEVAFMQAEMALARRDFAAAERTLAAVAGNDDHLAYGLFNLGVAYREAGDLVAARGAFARLGDLRVHSEPAWDVVQRGRLALAVTARSTGDPSSAETVLGSLPARGRYRDMALAGFARSAMERRDHELAARIWLTLLEGDGWSPSRAAAHLGLPMSLERLAAPAHALDRYREAERVFERRLASLEEAADRVADPVWVEGLLEASATASAGSDGDRRRERLVALDAGVGPETWLEWLAREDVHRVVMEWRELDDMARWLRTLPDTLATFQEITVERRRRAARARGALDDEALARRRDALAAELAAREAELESLERQPARMDAAWMQRLADAGEAELLERLQSMAAGVDTNTSGAERARLAARIRRLTGMVFWRIADDRSARLRELTRRVQETRRLLADVDGRIDRLTRAESRFRAGVEADFTALGSRAGAVTGQVAAALDARERELRLALARHLEEEMARTREHLLTARIAIARATDRLAAASPETAP